MARNRRDSNSGGALDRTGRRAEARESARRSVAWEDSASHILDILTDKKPGRLAFPKRQGRTKRTTLSLGKKEFFSCSLSPLKSSMVTNGGRLLNNGISRTARVVGLGGYAPFDPSYPICTIKSRQLSRKIKIFAIIFSGGRKPDEGQGPEESCRQSDWGRGREGRDRNTDSV